MRPTRNARAFVEAFLEANIPGLETRVEEMRHTDELEVRVLDSPKFGLTARLDQAMVESLDDPTPMLFPIVEELQRSVIERYGLEEYVKREVEKERVRLTAAHEKRLADIGHELDEFKSYSRRSHGDFIAARHEVERDLGAWDK